MEAKIEITTEESILSTVNDMLGGSSDQRIVELLDSFKYSAKPDENTARIEEISGYKSDEPEFTLQSEILRSIKASELYKAHPAVEVDLETVLSWKRSFYAIKSLSEVAEDTIRIKGIKNILNSISSNPSTILGVGENLQSAVLSALKKYLGE